MNLGEYTPMDQLQVFYLTTLTTSLCSLNLPFLLFSRLHVSECGAAVSVEGAARGALLPAQVWLPGVPLDRDGDQQTGAGPEGQWGRPGGGWTGRVWPEGVQGGRIFQRM